MPSLPELSTANLRNAGDAIETLIEFRDYLPPGGMMLMQAGQFRDQIRALLALPAAPRVSRGPERKTLDTLEDAELERLFGAVFLLVGGLTGYMDNPELPRHLTNVFRAIIFEREARVIAEEVKAS